MSLSDTKLRKLKPTAKDKWHSDGNRLYLRQRATGGLTWIIRRRKQDGGNITLGTYPKLSCAEARKKNAALAGKTVVTNTTLGELLQDWYDDTVAKTYRRPHHVAGYISRLDVGLKATKLRNLERLEVRRSLRQYAEDRGPVAARRLLSVLKTAMRFAVDAGYIDDSPIERLSPDLVGAPEVTRARVLTDTEIALLWRAESQHTPLLRFLLLTGQRIGETQLARWTDIEGGRWRIPASHTKNGRAHWVGLSTQAVDLLSAQNRGRALIFATATNTGTQAWVRTWCAKHELAPAFTPHDLRRTFATRAADLGVMPHIVEKILNHTMQGVMAVYNRAEYEAERVQAMQIWADALKVIVSQAMVVAP